MEILERKETKSIKAEWLEFLYDEVLVYYETDGRDFSGFHLDKNPFLANLSIFGVFGAKIESWFFHLRNAIAHNRIFTKANEDTLILQDVKSGNLSMYAEIVSFEKLKEIITEIKKNYKK